MEKESEIRTRELVLLTLSLLAIPQAGLVVVLLHPLDPGIASSGFVAIGSFFLVALFGWSLLHQYGINLRKKGTSPRLAWMYLHALYWLMGVLNGFIIYASILYIVSGGSFVLNWPFMLSFSALATWLSNYFLLNSLGQEYETFRGASFVGAGAFAKLARGMFMANRREGLSFLIRSLRMAGTLFEQHEYAPKNQSVLYATVESMSETDSIPYGSYH